MLVSLAPSRSEAEAIDRVRTLEELKAACAAAQARETAWLPVEARRRVDELMAGRLAVLGERRLGGEARAHAQRLDPAAAVKHTDRATRERRVSVRPAPGRSR